MSWPSTPDPSIVFTTCEHGDLATECKVRCAACGCSCRRHAHAIPGRYMAGGRCECVRCDEFVSPGPGKLDHYATVGASGACARCELPGDLWPVHGCFYPTKETVR